MSGCTKQRAHIVIIKSVDHHQSMISGSSDHIWFIAQKPGTCCHCTCNSVTASWKIIVKHINCRLVRPELSLKFSISRINPRLKVCIAHKIIKAGSELLGIGHISGSMLLYKFLRLSQAFCFQCGNLNCNALWINLVFLAFYLIACFILDQDTFRIDRLSSPVLRQA